MLEYKRLLYLKKLKELFEESDAQSVLEWYIANEARKPVVLVGAGFTKNARLYGDDARDLPLWSHILDQFRGELGFTKAQDTHDALTLAELYQEQMKPDGLRNKIYKMFPDDDLEPGDAHNALADYPAEAVITTNAFDTVLDKGRCKGRFDPVVSDIDLSRLDDDNPRMIQLLYVHGHRSCPQSWVFTRSQYEDIQNTRPRIITRVKQLIAQRPMLIVGYSLADPDFHYFYRDIALSMGGYHPLSLAILTHDASDAEKKHWENLGVRIVMPRKLGKTFQTYNEFFKRFFGISPSPESPFADYEDVKMLFENKSFADRLKIFQSVMCDKQRKRVVEISDDYQLFRLWDLVGSRELAKKEIEKIREMHDQISSESHERAFGTIGGNPPRKMTRPEFTNLPGELFRVDEETPWIVDKLLSQKIEYELLNEWFIEALNNDEVFQSHSFFWSPVVIVEMAAVISHMAILEHPGNARLKHQRTIIEEALRRLTVKYRIKKNFQKKLEQYWDYNSVEEDGDFSKAKSGPVYLQHMKSGFESCMIGEWENAWTNYRHAFDIANAKGNEWEAWAAAQSAFSIYGKWLKSPFDSPAQWQQYRQELNKLEKQDGYSAWKAERDDLVEKILKKELTNKKNEELKEKWGTSSYDYHNLYYLYWVMVRRIESIHMSPVVVSEFQEIMLEIPNNLMEQLHVRLKSNFKKTGRWLKQQMAKQEEYGNLQFRPEEIVHTILSYNKYDVYKLSAIKALCGVSEFIPQKDIVNTVEFILAARSDVGPSPNVFNESLNIVTDYAEAFFPLLKFCSPKDGIVYLKKFIADTTNFRTAYFSWRWISTLRWDEWQIQDENTFVGFMEIVSGADQRIIEDPHFVESCLNSLHQMLHTQKRLGLPIPASGQIENICDRVFSQNFESHVWHMKIIALLVKGMITDIESEYQLMCDLFIEQQNRLDEIRCLPDEKIDFIAGLITACWDFLDESGELHDIYLSFVKKLEESHSDWLRHISLNPGSFAFIQAFLAKSLQYNFPKSSLSQLRCFALETLAVSPQDWWRYADILDPCYWENDWKNVVDLLKKQSKGENIETPYLFRAKAYGAISTKLPLHEDCKFLFLNALENINHKDRILANHAAFAVVHWAHNIEKKNEVRKAIAALKKIANDNRTIVKMAAAYAAGRFEKANVAPEISDACKKLSKKFEDDPCAIIQYQLRSGRCWASSKLIRESE